MYSAWRLLRTKAKRGALSRSQSAAAAAAAGAWGHRALVGPPASSRSVAEASSRIQALDRRPTRLCASPEKKTVQNAAVCGRSAVSQQSTSPQHLSAAAAALHKPAGGWRRRRLAGLHNPSLRSGPHIQPRLHFKLSPLPLGCSSWVLPCSPCMASTQFCGGGTDTSPGRGPAGWWATCWTCCRAK